ncbi:MAG: PTS sugar transporter subunit IIA [bacterium]
MQIIWSNKNLPKKQKSRQSMQGADLISYFSEDLFVPDVKSKTKKELFDEFADLFVHAKLIRKKEIVVEMLSKRETLGSTGIGKGVAIPHGRTTAALEVKIAFGKSEAGMEFAAIDKKPVHLIFMVMAPPHDEDNRYLPVLGKLVEILNESSNRKKFLKVETFDEFLHIFEGAN